MSDYLKMGTQSAFSELEELVSQGYSGYGKIQKEYLELKEQGVEQDQKKQKNWESSCTTWIEDTAKGLTDIYASANYSNEFVVANRGGGMRVSTGSYSTLMQNYLGHIRKLEEYRNRLLNKSSLTINNSGQINVQVGDNLSNEQSE